MFCKSVLSNVGFIAFPVPPPSDIVADVKIFKSCRAVNGMRHWPVIRVIYGASGTLSGTYIYISHVYTSELGNLFCSNMNIM